MTSIFVTVVSGYVFQVICVLETVIRALVSLLGRPCPVSNTRDGFFVNFVAPSCVMKTESENEIAEFGVNFM
jgi:hypothetical protein